MPGDGAVAGPRVPARRGLVAEEHVPHAVGPPPHGGDNRGEQRDHGGADGGGEVRGARVTDDDGVGLGEDARELGQPGASAQVQHGRCAGASDSARRLR